METIKTNWTDDSNVICVVETAFLHSIGTSFESHVARVYFSQNLFSNLISVYT